VGFTDFDAPQLNAAVRDVFIELQGKLVALHKQLKARRRMTASTTQKPADRPVIYLDADPDEKTLWQNLKCELKDVAIVQPARLLQANGDTDPLDRNQQKQRQEQFRLSHGLVLLHGRPGAWIERAVAVTYLDRQLLLQRDRDLPWAILDQVGERPAVADVY